MVHVDKFTAFGSPRTSLICSKFLLACQKFQLPESVFVLAGPFLHTGEKHILKKQDSKLAFLICSKLQ